MFQYNETSTEVTRKYFEIYNQSCDSLNFNHLFNAAVLNETMKGNCPFVAEYPPTILGLKDSLTTPATKLLTQLTGKYKYYEQLTSCDRTNRQQ